MVFSSQDTRVLKPYTPLYPTMLQILGCVRCLSRTRTRSLSLLKDLAVPLGALYIVRQIVNQNSRTYFFT